MTAEEWNARHPVGTPVVYVPNAAEPNTTLRTRTRSAAWTLGHGEAVVLVNFRTGGVALDHLIIDREDRA